jgi:hypothetical protein
MPHLEPTYLRYIYDGLLKGSIHPENAAELPEGLIGLYEEAFDERNSVVERQKLLQRFAIWALLKKEVSAAFVAEVLGETEDEIQDFISAYSAWFNSPESGKYQLYHERLKVYLLQKLSEGEVAKLNNLIVDFLLQKVNEVKQNESVSYCFENLSFHLFLNAYLAGDSDLLAQYCLDENFKKRQFELSGYYDWEEKMMTLGVEYFSLKQDSICHQIVFEKTKIQFKKKDIDLILSLIRSGDMETVFRFFQNTSETNLYARVQLAYFYILSFFEIFENHNWNFIQKKEVAFKLLEIFKENFEWEIGYWLSSFVDVNISFRLHCYFEQYGLDFLIIAKLSFDTTFKTFDFASNSELKFICSNHQEEGKIILNKSKQFDYGLSKKSFEDLLKSNQFEVLEEIKLGSLERKIKSFSKTKLLRDELPSISYDSASFSEIYLSIIYSLSKPDSPWDLQMKILRCFKETFYSDSNNSYSISGILEDLDGKNTLGFIKKDLVQIKQESSSLSELIENGLDLGRFMSMDLSNRYLLLSDECLNSDDDIELMLFLLEISEYYQNNKASDSLELFSALLVEFHLNMNDELIDNYINQLIELIESQFQEASEDFESKQFHQIIDFLGRKEINGYRIKTTRKIKDLLLEKYFDFNLYIDSFICGCKLINLFSKLRIAYQEDQIVERILEDLNFLIEENDYNDLQEIDCSYIDNIYQKKYFTEFYCAIKKIPVEEVRINLSKYVFDSIIEVKGLNHNTVSFIKENSNEYPGMYLWAQNRISQKLLKKNEELSYVVIKDNNDLLLERLLLNIVSKRENLKDELNLHILNHFGLDWVIELDNQYEKLISTN